ncbi:sulfotransferase domain-containing protein [Pseudooceanicola sp. CBS1P-1]|uniref:Sulfotransferase domain-containing protein n=1 Tax=Pseudooceanicola albus TaxID=2692189 RepID=A0A6L7GB14_9RHOB|nr:MULTISPECIES: sulfotransferase domain-containing protein [Pseudooceanicola]MBT9386740.1 sulfotransferase domain-containing protein [Pseudooceanicola endophyticus]MXN20777.1 hypothetical protein [Pseudooceanicola albus]
MPDTLTALRLPDLYICGFTKCATSSLHDWLVQHPKISGGFQKELEFLYDRDSYFYRPECNIHAQGPEGYAALFSEAPEGALWLDATPAYAHHETARLTIAGMENRPPVVFVTRRPVDQISSTYHYFSNNKLYIDPSITIERFFEMVIDGSARTAFEQDHLKHALDWACFDYWLALWRRDLGEDRVIHLEMREMLKDPAAAVNGIVARLGLDPLAALDQGGANETYFVKNRGLQKLNTMVRGFIPKGALYDTARSLYRKMNTTTGKPERSAHEEELRAALAQAVEKRQAELLATL